MGGCASRPKDLDTNEPAPVQAPVVDKPESEPVAQENNGGEETKTEEPSVDVSEPTTRDAVVSSESKPADEAAPATTDAKPDNAETEVKAEAKAEAEAVPEPKAEAVPEPKVEVVATSEPEKITPEPVKEEAKPVEAQKPEDNKNDAPVVTM